MSQEIKEIIIFQCFIYIFSFSSKEIRSDVDFEGVAIVNAND